MRTKSTGGFTLIELLIVIAIIGILAAVLIPNLMNARRVAVDRAAQGYVQNVYTAAMAHMAEVVTADAATTAALATDCSAGATFGSYSVSAPSFTVDDCEVGAVDGEIGVALEYSGGVNDEATIGATLP